MPGGWRCVTTNAWRPWFFEALILISPKTLYFLLTRADKIVLSTWSVILARIVTHPSGQKTSYTWRLPGLAVKSQQDCRPASSDVPAQARTFIKSLKGGRRRRNRIRQGRVPLFLSCSFPSPSETWYLTLGGCCNLPSRVVAKSLKAIKPTPWHIGLQVYHTQPVNDLYSQRLHGNCEC